jgi:hypothetical protein
MSITVNSMEITNLKIKTRASWMNTTAHMSQLVGLTMKMRMIEMIVAIPNKIDAPVFLLILSIINMSG